MNTPIVEGSIERHKSRLVSRETGNGLTGIYSGGSLDRTEKVPKWPREHHARAGLREASRRDKVMRSWSLNVPDASSRCLRSLRKLIAFDFFLLLYGLFVLSTICSSSGKRFDAGSLIRSFGRDIKSNLKRISLKVDSCLPN